MKNNDNPVMGRNSCVIKQEYEKSLDFGSELKTQLWVCGLYNGLDPHGGRTWELVGVYTTEKLALDACKTNLHFIGPVILNESVHEKSVFWPGAYYPKRKWMFNG